MAADIKKRVTETNIEPAIKEFSKLGIFSHNPQNGIGLWREEQELLLDLVGDATSYFEIGSHNLGSALLVERHAWVNQINRVVWALDIEFSPWAQLNYGRANSNINMLEMSSSDIRSMKNKPENIQRLFIDGYHSFKQVVIDFNGMYESLADNAIVIFHDTSPKLNDLKYREERLDFVEDNIDFLSDTGHEDFYVDEAIVAILEEYPTTEIIDCTTECFHPRETQLNSWIRGKTSPHSAIWAMRVTK